MIAPVALGLLLLPSPARGFVAGAFAATVVFLLAFWVVQVTGTGPAMMGDLGEQWTASELRKLRRSGWRIVNGVRLNKWDIDHVLVGPGGVFAVETKWSASEWKLAPPGQRITSAVDQARANAKSLRLWQPFKEAGVNRVDPVVVIWGTGISELADDVTLQRHGDAVVVTGTALARWRDSLRNDVLTGDQVATLWLALDAQLRRRDAHDQAASSAPPSITLIIARTTITIATAFAGSLATLKAFSLTGSTYWWIAVVACLAVGGLGLRKVGALRYLGTALLVGIASVLVVVVASLGTLLR